MCPPYDPARRQPRRGFALRRQCRHPRECRDSRFDAIDDAIEPLGSSLVRYFDATRMAQPLRFTHQLGIDLGPRLAAFA